MDWIDADLVVLARTLYGEVGTEAWPTKVAVAWVVKNRVVQGGAWGRCVEAVCQKPYAFSCWTPHNPRLDVITQVTPASVTFRECLAAAAAVLCDLEPDPTGGATASHPVQQHPAWADQASPTCIIGSRLFYRAAAPTGP
jgi:N-acetylmuramoyl-L-alanine amidase